MPEQQEPDLETFIKDNEESIVGRSAELAKDIMDKYDVDRCFTLGELTDIVSRNVKQFIRGDGVKPEEVAEYDFKKNTKHENYVLWESLISAMQIAGWDVLISSSVNIRDLGNEVGDRGDSLRVEYKKIRDVQYAYNSFKETLSGAGESKAAKEFEAQLPEKLREHVKTDLGGRLEYLKNAYKATQILDEAREAFYNGRIDLFETYLREASELFSASKGYEKQAQNLNLLADNIDLTWRFATADVNRDFRWVNRIESGQYEIIGKHIGYITDNSMFVPIERMDMDGTEIPLDAVYVLPAMPKGQKVYWLKRVENKGD